MTLLTDAEITRLRIDFTGTLDDEGRVLRLAAKPVFDPVAGTYTDPADTEIYDGAMRVQPRVGTERVVMVGEQPITVRTYDVSLPYDADSIRVDDYVVLDASRDTELVGRRLRVLDVAWSSVQAGRRLICQDELG